MTPADRAGRPVTSTITSIEARCSQCDWTATSANALGISARHHDHTGHTVTVDVARRITYGDPHAQPANQTSLLDELEALT